MYLHASPRHALTTRLAVGAMPRRGFRACRPRGAKAGGRSLGFLQVQTVFGKVEIGHVTGVFPI